MHQSITPSYTEFLREIGWQKDICACGSLSDVLWIWLGPSPRICVLPSSSLPPPPAGSTPTLGCPLLRKGSPMDQLLPPWVKRNEQKQPLLPLHSSPNREESAACLKLGAKVSCHLGLKPEGKPGIQKFSTCSSLEVERGTAGPACSIPSLSPPAQHPPLGVSEVTSMPVESHQYIGWSNKKFWEGPGPQVKLLQEYPQPHHFFHSSSAKPIGTDGAFQRLRLPPDTTMLMWSISTCHFPALHPLHTFSLQCCPALPLLAVASLTWPPHLHPSCPSTPGLSTSISSTTFPGFCSLCQNGWHEFSGFQPTLLFSLPLPMLEISRTSHQLNTSVP